MGIVAFLSSENMIDHKLRNFNIKHVKYFALILVAGCLLNQLRIRLEIGKNCLFNCILPYLFYVHR